MALHVNMAKRLALGLAAACTIVLLHLYITSLDKPLFVIQHESDILGESVQTGEDDEGVLSPVPSFDENSEGWKGLVADGSSRGNEVKGPDFSREEQGALSWTHPGEEASKALGVSDDLLTDLFGQNAGQEENFPGPDGLADFFAEEIFLERSKGRSAAVERSILKLNAAIAEAARGSRENLSPEPSREFAENELLWVKSSTGLLFNFTEAERLWLLHVGCHQFWQRLGLSPPEAQENSTAAQEEPMDAQANSAEGAGPMRSGSSTQKLFRVDPPFDPESWASFQNGASFQTASFRGNPNLQDTSGSDASSCSDQPSKPVVIHLAMPFWIGEKLGGSYWCPRCNLSCEISASAEDASHARLFVIGPNSYPQRQPGDSRLIIYLGMEAASQKQLNQAKAEGRVDIRVGLDPRNEVQLTYAGRH